MGPHHYLQVLRRRWLLVLAATLVALGAAAVATQGPSPEQRSLQASRDRVYQANVLLLQTADFEFGNLETLATLTTIGEVPLRAADALEVATPADIPAEVTAVGDRDTGFLHISATGRPAGTVERVADTYAAALISWLLDREAEQADALIGQITGRIDELTNDITELETAATAESGSPQIIATAELEAKTRQLAALQERLQQLLAPPPDAGLTVVQPAQARQVLPETAEFAGVVPESRPAQLAAAGLLGLLLGAGLALVVESADRRIRTREQVEEHLKLPVLAELPRRPAIRKDGPEQPWAVEVFGLLAAGLTASARSSDTDGQRGPVVLVTSPSPGDGRTTVVECLAAYCRNLAQDVTVLSGAVHTDPDRERDASGNGVANTLSARRLAVREARSTSDLVLIDAPAILSVGDAAHLLADVDAVVVVVRVRRTTVDEAARTRQLLELFSHVHGFAVLNGVPERTAATPQPWLEPWTRGLSRLSRQSTDA